MLDAQIAGKNVRSKILIKIIKPGYLKEIQCGKCGAVLSYDGNEDIETRYEKV